MRAKDFIPADKPRNFVAKHAKTAGAGAHRDKKKEQKQGYEKHKNKGVAEGNLEEGWKDKVAAAALAGTMALGAGAAHGRVVPGQDSDPGINRLTGKPIATQVQKADQGKSADSKGFSKEYLQKAANPDRTGRFLISVERAQELLQQMGESIEMERVRDPEDWDEGNTEPPNNFAVYINGKKWKVFQGRGMYADDAREKAHFQQLKDWARKKSIDTGKKWEVYITGERATD